MARKNYRLSDETFLVLSGNEANIAREFDCDPSYIYAIKNGDAPDRFAQFLPFFRAIAYAGAKAEIFLNVLNGILINARPLRNCKEFSSQIIEKIRTDAECTEQMITAIADGNLDKSECHNLLSVIAKTKRLLEKLERILHKRLGELDEGAG